jgi:hypothetical protein
VKKNPTLLIVAGLSAAGVVAGAGAKLLTIGHVTPQAVAPASGNDRSRPSSGTAEGGIVDAHGKPVPKFTPPVHSPSKDTLETLAALNDNELYSRLAAWMIDASEQDIAAYWNGYLKKQNRSNDITDLVFINWTRLNPQGAIAATAGTSSDHYAWWAWAAHDPKAALAAALAANPDRVNNVAWGIGEFHPDWLRKHFNELPESARGNAFSGLSKWGGAEDPLEMIKFRQENKLGFDNATFTALVRKDPWSALDWVKENPKMNSGNGDAMQMLVKQMAMDRPDDLARLVTETPSGDAKRKMEAALFDNLVKTDPEAALEQAKATDTPRTAAERFAAIGLTVVKSDPDQAFSLAKDLLTACPTATEFMTMVQYPNGGSGSGGALAGVSELMESLMAKDPSRLMDLASGLQKDERGGNKAFNNLSSQWVERDLVAYTGWVNQQTDPDVRDRGAGVLVNQLMNDEHFQDAVDWAMSMKSDRNFYLRNTFNRWGQKAPDEALERLNTTDMPEDERTRLQKFISRTNAKDQ